VLLGEGMTPTCPPETREQASFKPIPVAHFSSAVDLAGSQHSRKFNGRYLPLVFLAVICCALAAEFVARGPVRAIRSATEFSDFLSLYVQTRAWISGNDPYNPVVIARLWPKEASRFTFLSPESIDGTLAARHGLPSPYPPTSFFLLVPVCVLPWPVAAFLWVAVTGLSFVSILRSTVRVTRRDGQTVPFAVIVLAAIALAPFHTAIALSNMIVTVFAIALRGIVDFEERRDLRAGILLAISFVLKPTIALPFLLYLLLRRGGRTLIISTLSVLGLTTIAWARMSIAGVHWLPSYLLNMRRMFEAGAINDFSFANPSRFDLVNLQVVLGQLLCDRGLTQLAAVACWVGLLVLWYSLRSRNQMVQEPLLDLAVLVTASLLPFYHRFYDASLLLIPIAWALTELAGPRRREAVGILVLASPFLVPGTAVIQSFAATGSFSHGQSSPWWWELFILSHQVWLTLLICTTLIGAQWKISRSGSLTA
jgi:glycosyl transferase family 87